MDKPVLAQKTPCIVELEAGKTYAWCRCGESNSQPFCDGTHKKTSIKPLIFKAEASQKVYLCGCKQTSNPPYCDGTHKLL